MSTIKAKVLKYRELENNNKITNSIEIKYKDFFNVNEGKKGIDNGSRQ